MPTETGKPHVTDFGLAKQMESVRSVTLSGQIMGTPQYMAPEQARGEKTLTTAADVYALGAILYELLTGSRPHQGESLMDTLRQVAEEEPATPSRLNPQVNRDLATIAMKGLEKDPAQRYDSALDLAEDLERWLRGEPILARPVGLTVKLIKWMKRKPAQALVLGLATLLLLALGVGGPIAAWMFRGMAAENLQLASDRQDALGDLEVKAEELATKAVELANKAEESRRHLYVAQMFTTGEALFTQDSLQRTRDKLQAWRPKSGEADLRGWEWYYLNGYRQKNEAFFAGDGRTTRSLQWSPDGATLVMRGSHGILKLLDGQNAGVITSAANYVKSQTGATIFSPDGSELLNVDMKQGFEIRDSRTLETKEKFGAIEGKRMELA
ncbi:MAG: hypothetical protein ACI9TH_003944 [Kiritimatiellia bacterium]|jgi:hypothetical protein